MKIAVWNSYKITPRYAVTRATFSVKFHANVFSIFQVARREKAIQKLELELLTAQENHRRALDDVCNVFDFHVPFRVK